MVKVVLSTMALAVAEVAADTVVATDDASLLQLSGIRALTAEVSGAECQINRQDMAKASLSAMKTAMNEPDFCYRQRRKRACEQWEPNHLRECPFQGCRWEAARCPSGTEHAGEVELCCQFYPCDDGFAPHDRFGCLQKCEGATPHTCLGNAACAARGACLITTLEMSLAVLDAVVSTVELFSPAGGVMAAINVAEKQTKEGLQDGFKKGLTKMKAKFKRLVDPSSPERRLAYENFDKTLKSMSSHLFDVNSAECKIAKTYMFGVTVNAVASTANNADDKKKFDFTQFDPTGFANAVKNSVDLAGGDASPEKVAAGWLGFAANFDPTGWLSVAAAFAKPKCKSKVQTREQQPFDKRTANHLCANRGGSGGSNQFSKNVGRRNPQACANYVHTVEGCGRWFSYGFLDGWCDCVRETSINPDGDCRSTTGGSAGKWEYAVYEIRESQPFQKQADNVLCSNRGGIGGSNQFSKNVGLRNPQACANYVHTVEGCGRWFNYGFLDGWCECVKDKEGVCQLTPDGSQGKYGVYTVGPPTVTHEIYKNETMTDIGDNYQYYYR